MGWWCWCGWVGGWGEEPHKHTLTNTHNFRFCSYSGVVLVLPQLTVEDGQRSNSALKTAVVVVGPRALRRLPQLFLHHGQRDLVGLQKVLHGDHLPGVPPVLRVRVSVSLRHGDGGGLAAPVQVSGGDGVATGHGRFLQAAAAVAVQPPQQPVENLLDDYGGDVEEAVDAAAAQHDEDEVAQAVEVHVVVAALLTHHVVPEADGGEGDEAEVDGFEVSPLFHRVVHRGGANSHHQSPQ